MLTLKSSPAKQSLPAQHGGEDHLEVLGETFDANQASCAVCSPCVTFIRSGSSDGVTSSFGQLRTKLLLLEYL